MIKFLLRSFVAFALILFAHASFGQTSYYSKPTGALNLVSSWGTNPDGSGSAPPNFTSANTVFVVANNPTATLNAAWNVSGANSKVVVGNGVEPVVFTIPAAYSMSGVVDVSASSKLVVLNTTMPTLGVLDGASTLQLAQSTPVTFNFDGLETGNLILANSTKIFTSSFVVHGKLTLNAAVFSVDAAPGPIELTLMGDAELLNNGAFATNCYEKLDLRISGEADQSFSTSSIFLSFRMRDLIVGKTAGTAMVNCNFVLSRDFLGQLSGTGLFSYHGISLDVGRNVSAAGSTFNYDLNTILYLTTPDSNEEHKLFGATEAEAPKAEFNSLTVYTSAANVHFMPLDGSGEYHFNGYFELGGDMAGEVFLHGNTFHIGGTILLSEEESVLNAEGSKIIMDGLVDQSIFSEDPNQTLHNLTLNKAAGKLLLESPFLFTGTVLLQHGKFYSNDFLTIAEEGNIVGNSLGYVVHSIKKVIATDEPVTFDFPTGEPASYMPISLDLTPSSAEPTTISVEYKPEALPEGDSGNELVMPQSGYYAFAVDGPAEMVESYLTLSYFLEFTPGLEDLVRVGMFVNGSWVNMGGTGTLTGMMGFVTSENTGGGGIFAAGIEQSAEGPFIGAPATLPMMVSYEWIPTDPVEVFVSSQNLTGDITATAAANFEVALAENGPFSNQVTATPQGIANAITVYVRYAPESGMNHSGIITFSSPGALNKYTNVSGSVTEVPAMFINELQANNTGTIADENGEYYNWIELYNPYNAALDLSGFYLSTSESVPDMYEFPAGTTIDANGFLLLWASGNPDNGANHTGIELSEGGGYLAFRDPNTSLIDLINYPMMNEVQSYGREFDGGLPWMYFSEPTPGASNEPVGVPEISENKLYIYPNPVVRGGNLHFNREVSRVRIYDIGGRLILSGEHLTDIETQSLEAGVYLISAEGAVMRLVVE